MDQHHVGVHHQCVEVDLQCVGLDQQCVGVDYVCVLLGYCDVQKQSHWMKLMETVRLVECVIVIVIVIGCRDECLSYRCREFRTGMDDIRGIRLVAWAWRGAGGGTLGEHGTWGEGGGAALWQKCLEVWMRESQKQTPAL